MKIFIGLLFSLVIAGPSLASHCKLDDLHECAAVLTKLHKAKVAAKKFARNFDVICAENLKLRCIKKVVRGDLKEEMKFTEDEHPNAHLYQVRLAGENYIFVLDKK